MSSSAMQETPTATRTNLNVGDRVRLLYGSAADATRWWTVRAADDRFVILTRQRDFAPKGESVYTIIDWERGVRGPCNLIGQGWDIDEPDGPEALLRALNHHLKRLRRLESGEAEVPVDEVSCEVSYRNNVPIAFARRGVSEENTASEVIDAEAPA